VNTAIYSPSGAYAGIGFAIPIETVNWVVPELIKHGKITRPDLGVSFASERITWQLGVEGALLLEVEPGSAAEQAGLVGTKRLKNGTLVLGDIIQAIDGAAVDSPNDVFAKVLSYKVGERVTLSVLRGPKTIQVSVILEQSRS
jgi:S1-C subfamily serine protease